MKIFFPGQKVPSEIQKVEMEGYKKGDPFLRFSSPSIVKRTEAGYYIRPIVLMGSVMSFKATCDHLNIVGCPEIEGGEVHMNCKPYIQNWLIIGVLALLLFLNGVWL